MTTRGLATRGEQAKGGTDEVGKGERKGEPGKILGKGISGPGKGGSVGMRKKKVRGR